MSGIPKNFICPSVRRLVYILMSSIRYQREGLSMTQFKRALALIVFQAAKEDVMGYQIGFEDVEDVASFKREISDIIDDVFYICNSFLVDEPKPENSKSQKLKNSKSWKCM